MQALGNWDGLQACRRCVPRCRRRRHRMPRKGRHVLAADCFRRHLRGRRQIRCDRFVLRSRGRSFLIAARRSRWRDGLRRKRCRRRRRRHSGHAMHARRAGLARRSSSFGRFLLLDFVLRLRHCRQAGRLGLKPRRQSWHHGGGQSGLARHQRNEVVTHSRTMSRYMLRRRALKLSTSASLQP
ncbi:hypothetical protein SAMN05428948_0815 [Massilia sp. CF038]|nr:hypothetical protein SAMN05428948_0815 [Massilia sp. CF038]